MSSKNLWISQTLILLFLSSIFIFPLISRNSFPIPLKALSKETFSAPVLHTSNYEQYSKGNFSDFKCSNYNLSVFLSEASATIAGNLTVEFYNNDAINFTQIPFHLYPSGMEYATQPGFIEILNVTTLEQPRAQIPFEVLSDQQLMWVNLTSDLEPEQRDTFCISFNTTLPDGGIDRANVHGDDISETKIFKFASSYPIPCVFDEEDGWNTDPYLSVGDPFYFDMAYYDLIVNVPEDMIVAASGELMDVNYYSNRKILHYNPHYPVREITFSASRYFISESNIINGVNISTYFLQNSYPLWHTWGLEVATESFTLYKNTLGVYPYNTFNVVEEHTGFGGMEYPLQVYITSTANEYDYPQYTLELFIAHETAHQWFYNMVGNDEVETGFLDEGIAVWITDYFRSIRHPSWYLFEPFRYLNTVREYDITDGLPGKINQSLYDALLINPYVYWDSAYKKTPTILEHLRRTVLHDDFIPSLRFFFQSHYFEFATLSDLIDACETMYGHSLDWFFLPWFNNAYLPKYNFTQVVYNTGTNIMNITITDLNEHLHENSYSQRILLRVYSDGPVLRYSEKIWINNTTTISIILGYIPERVDLLYDNDVLVQFSYLAQGMLITFDIDITDIPPNIPGFDIVILITSFILLGFLIISKANKKSKN